MLTKSKRGWELPESAATPEGVFWNRRALLKAAATVPLIAAAGPLAAQLAAAEEAGADPTAALYPAKRNDRYVLDRALTAENEATTYNNYYEFGSQKQIARAAQKLPIRPWMVAFDGLVEEPRTVDIDTLIKAIPIEERLYRHRCVEAWAMAVPWSGFAMKALVEYARPKGQPKYIAMETFANAAVAPGQREFWYPWPYREGLTMAEATNELAFIATGMYGKPIPRQDGAPLRLVTPWKYGFKSIKSIVKFTFTDERPVSFWEKIQAQEYGFWANVNPTVPHPRWSQAQEHMLGTGEIRPTLLFNGYGEFVADLYKGLESEKLYM